MAFLFHGVDRHSIYIRCQIDQNPSKSSDTVLRQLAETL
jgi:hypothetical protein